MYSYQYPHPALTADCVLFGKSSKDGKIYLLLIERGNEPYKGCWAFPGGFMNIDETIEKCAARELQEETGATGVELHQVGVFSTVDRDPRERVVSVAFYAMIDKDSYGYVKGGDDARQAEWFDLNNLPELAFDHKEILAAAIKKSSIK